jgi:predicted ATPase
VVNVVDFLLARGAITEVAGTWQLASRIAHVVPTVPDSLRELIEKQIDRLSRAEQRLLKAASVAGEEFFVLSVAGALDEAPDEVEERCDKLVRRQAFLRELGPHAFPDGTVTARNAFLHALYRKALYDRLAAGRRRRFHQRIGECEEQLYGGTAREAAAALAVHFERGGDPRRAVDYSSLAAENAMQRYAPREAIDLITRALRGLEALRRGGERDLQRDLVVFRFAQAIRSAKTLPRRVNRGRPRRAVGRSR